MASVIKTRVVDSVILSGLNNIKQYFRHVGDRYGWHQYLGSEKIGNIATSQALLILSKFQVDFDKKHLAIENIAKSQVVDNCNKASDGGWTYITNFSSRPSSEATCWALLALQSERQHSETIRRGISWLFQNQVDGAQDEGWGTIKEDKSRVYTTCLVVKTLKALGYEHSNQVERGINYLLKSQNSDGGWGEKLGFDSSVTHTAHVIITLIEVSNKIDSQAVKKGVDWLLQNFIFTDKGIIEKGGYQEIIEFDSFEDGANSHQRLIYYHLPIPYAIIALVKYGNINNQRIFLGLNYLLNNNNDGYWFHPHLAGSNRKPLWAIYDSLFALKEFRDVMAGWLNLNEVLLKNGKIILIDNVNPFNPARFFEKFIKGIWGKIFVIILLCIASFYFFKFFPSLKDKDYMAIVLIPLVAELLGYYVTEVREK
jgi:hypothetical protein